jgi:N-acetylmuramoyl-L-alanine amidase
VCPPIVNQAEWQALPAIKVTPLPEKPASTVIIHHTASAPCNQDEVCVIKLRDMQHFHVVFQKWDDIGFNFLIGGNGVIYEGRGWGVQGVDTKGFDSKSVSISFIGEFKDILPEDAALEAANKLIKCGVSLGHISETYILIGHRQISSTSCPGSKLFGHLRTLDRFQDEIEIKKERLTE